MILPPLSRAMQLLLLERAVLVVHERYGLPSSPEEQAFFDLEVDVLYRGCLMARRSASPRTFESAARAQAVAKVAARKGAAYAAKSLADSVYCRSLAILAEPEAAE